MAINPNFGNGLDPVSFPGQLPPVPSVGEDTDTQDPLLLSTLSPSQQEALQVLYLMNFPLLPQPALDGNGNNSLNAETIGAIVGAKFAQIGSEMWDRYLDHLAEQKERIAQELSSPAYLAFLERQSPSYIAAIERNTPIDTQNAIRNSTEYQEWLSTLPAAAREKELGDHHALGLWSNYIDGVTGFLNRARDEVPDAVPFIAASFVISMSFIDNFSSIVDVLDQGFIDVKPLQEVISPMIQLVPQTLQESFVLAINLYAMGLITFANAEAVGNSLRSGDPAATKDTVLAFARSVIEKVATNEINYLLMAILINNTEDGAPVTDQRMNQLAAMAKAVMMSVALAALYKVETGWITSEEFQDMLEGNMEPRSEEESVLVELFQNLRLETVRDGLLLEDDWENLMHALGLFIRGNPSVEDMLNPTKIYTGLGRYLQNPELEG